MADRWSNNLDYRAGGRVIREPLPAQQRTRIEADIARTMRDVVDDAWRRGNPLQYPGAGRPKSEEEQRAAALAGTPVASAPAAPQGTGWREARPLEVPGGATAQAAIEAMAHTFQPHGLGNPEYRGPAAERALARAVGAARATPKAEAPVPQAAAPEASEAVPEVSAPEPARATQPAPVVAARHLYRSRQRVRRSRAGGWREPQALVAPSARWRTGQRGPRVRRRRWRSDHADGAIGSR